MFSTNKNPILTTLVILLLTTSVFALSPTKRVEAFDLQSISTVLQECTDLNFSSLLKGALSSIGGWIGGSIPGIGGAVPVTDEAVESATGNLAQKESCGDAIAREAQQVALNELRGTVVTWIQGGTTEVPGSGFESGNPGFVTNLEQRLRDQIQLEFVRFIQNSQDLHGICEIWREGTKEEIVRGFIQDYNDRLDISSGITITEDMLALPEIEEECALTQATGGAEETEAFISGDFTLGGWDAWRALINDAQSNPITARIQAQQRLYGDLSAAQQREVEQLQFGEGFKPDYRCPGNTPAELNGLCEVDGRIVAPTIVTPPSIVQTIIARTTESDLMRLELADELGEVLEALGETLIGRIIEPVGGGLSGGGTITEIGSGAFGPDPLPDDATDEQCKDWSEDAAESAVNATLDYIEQLNTIAATTDGGDDFFDGTFEQRITQATQTYRSNLQGLLVTAGLSVLEARELAEGWVLARSTNKAFYYAHFYNIVIRTHGCQGGSDVPDIPGEGDDGPGGGVGDGGGGDDDDDDEQF